eukprot:355910-Chlamydomonas_euryale.AAC.4
MAHPNCFPTQSSCWRISLHGRTWDCRSLVFRRFTAAYVHSEASKSHTTPKATTKQISNVFVIVCACSACTSEAHQKASSSSAQSLLYCTQQHAKHARAGVDVCAMRAQTSPHVAGRAPAAQQQLKFPPSP